MNFIRKLEMDFLRIIIYWSNKLICIRRDTGARFVLPWILLATATASCDFEPSGSDWFAEDNLTISQYIKKNKEEYSKSFRLLAEGKMLNPLYAYNPHGEDYTLFLPTNEAIDRFIQQNQDYKNFEALLLDTGFIYTLTRYHTLNRKVHTDKFPFGALSDRTLTWDRLVFGFSTDGSNQLIKVNNTAPIIESNLDMTNGYIHVISEVLQPAQISGYDWLQQQDDYSILAQAMELSGIRERLRWSRYTILAEHDSIYHRKGIHTIEDLINRVATPGIPYSHSTNSFYMFSAYHIFSGEFYLNDLFWGKNEYWTFLQRTIMIDVGLRIRINPGVNTYGITVSDSGDTTVIDYILPVWEESNIMTRTGPVHSISDVLYFKKLPKEIR